LPHLAKFLSRRAQELRVGGEMVLIMVGDPYAWVSLPDRSIFSRAIQRCIEREEVRPSVLENAVVPYYLRSLNDLEEAVALSNELNDESLTLELVDTRKIRLDVGKGDLDAAFSLFWSVHQGAIRAGGATEDEMERIQNESRKVNREFFSPLTGIETTYLAIVLRRTV